MFCFENSKISICRKLFNGKRFTWIDFPEELVDLLEGGTHCRHRGLRRTAHLWFSTLIMQKWIYYFFFRPKTTRNTVEVKLESLRLGKSSSTHALARTNFVFPTAENFHNALWSLWNRKPCGSCLRRDVKNLFFSRPQYVFT